MQQKIEVTVNEHGDLHVDFSGYIGASCQFDEEEMRRMLAELGLKAEIKGLKSKLQNEPQNKCAEKIPQGTKVRV
ncbi:MAG: hypothetical protein IBX72_11440 [Nitrospirae bacterium]|nr:hypothetical protein [Nitrospirota bacterium]